METTQASAGAVMTQPLGLPYDDHDGLFAESEEMELNFGPQHPATHGVLRLKLKINGEKIVDTYPIIGYLHRGTEKLFELHPFFQNVPHTDRMDYVAAATNNQAYVGAVEKLLGRGAAAGPLYPDDARRAPAHFEPPALARHARDRQRRHDAVLLYLPRARADSRSVRGVLRRPVDAQLHAPGRPAARSSGRLDGSLPQADGRLPGQARRVRGVAHQQPHLEEADGGHRRAPPGRGDRLRDHRPDAPRQRHPLGCAQGAPLRGL